MTGPPSPEVTEAFCRVPSTQFSQAPRYSLPVHLCRFRVRSDGGLFPGTAELPGQSDKTRQRPRSVTSSWPRNIDLVPIDYAFRPRLRGRLTLLRLASSRNPWTFGGGVSHTPYRYSRQHSRYRSLHRWLTPRLHRQILRLRRSWILAGPTARSRSLLEDVSVPSFERRARWPAPKPEQAWILSRYAPLPCARRHIRSFGSWLEPRYIFAAGQLA
jgi:hypothetical protein